YLQGGVLPVVLLRVGAGKALPTFAELAVLNVAAGRAVPAGLDAGLVGAAMVAGRSLKHAELVERRDIFLLLFAPFAGRGIVKEIACLEMNEGQKQLDRNSARLRLMARKQLLDSDVAETWNLFRRHFERRRNVTVADPDACRRWRPPASERRHNDVTKDRLPLSGEPLVADAELLSSALGVPSKEHHVGECVCVAFSRRDAIVDRIAFGKQSRIVEL